MSKYMQEVDDMKNIAEFIKSHKELNELPFLIVFRVISFLNEKGMMKNVDRIS